MLDKYHATITEALDMGFMARLTQDEVDSLKDRNHYFIFQNVVLNKKSSSMPLRRISDTSRPIGQRFNSGKHATYQGKNTIKDKSNQGCEEKEWVKR